VITLLSPPICALFAFVAESQLLCICVVRLGFCAVLPCPSTVSSSGGEPHNVMYTVVTVKSTCKLAAWSQGLPKP